MKTKFKFMLGLACAAMLVSAQAQSGYYATTSPKLAVFGAVTNQVQVSTNLVWPTSIAAGVSWTNVTPFAVNGHQTTIQVNIAYTTTMAASTTNTIIQIGRSVQLPSQMPPHGVTNNWGTGLNIDWFATITNTAVASLAAGTVSTSLASFGVQPGQSSGAFDAACTTYYIGNITAPAGGTITNYSIYVNSQ